MTWETASVLVTPVVRRVTDRRAEKHSGAANPMQQVYRNISKTIQFRNVRFVLATVRPEKGCCRGRRPLG